MADAPTTTATTGATEEPEAPALSESSEAALARLQPELGDAIIEHGGAFGGLVVRVRPDAWRRTAQFCKQQLGCDYLSFVSVIDWLPTPTITEEGSGDTSAPVQPKEMTFGVAGSAGRMQVFAHVESTHQPELGITFKVDVDDDDPHAESWVSVYPGADWHEREAWEMYGVVFDGHPEPASPLPSVRVRRPSAAQGLPVARPRGEAVARSRRRRADAGRARGCRRRDCRRRRGRCNRVTTTPTDLPQPGELPEVDVDPTIYRHLADSQMNVELDTGDMVLNIGPQHPATHGTLRLVVRLDGERVVAADPVIGYMHRGYEKLTEYRTYPQITTLINRIDWLSSFANEVPFIHAAEQLMNIEAPPRAEWIRTALTELSRIATFLLFLGEMGLQVGAITPAFYGFRDREYVLNLIEAATGGRFHPNFNRIGGIKEDLPWGWISDCREAMRKVLESCDTFEDLVVGNPIFEQRTRSIGIIPGELGATYGVSGSNLRASGVDWDLRRDGKPYLVVPTSSTGRCGPTRTATRSRATGCACRRRVSRRAWCCRLIDGLPAGPIMAKVPRIIKVPEGEVWVNTENPLGEMGYYVVSKGATGPFRVKIRSASFSNVSILDWLLRGVYVPDVITILASLYFILGDIDR